MHTNGPYYLKITALCILTLVITQAVVQQSKQKSLKFEMIASVLKAFDYAFLCTVPSTVGQKGLRSMFTLLSECKQMLSLCAKSLLFAYSLP